MVLAWRTVEMLIQPEHEAEYEKLRPRSAPAYPLGMGSAVRCVRRAVWYLFRYLLDHFHKPDFVGPWRCKRSETA